MKFREILGERTLEISLRDFADFLATDIRKAVI